MRRFDLLLILVVLISVGCGDGSGGRLKGLGGAESPPRLPSPAPTRNAKIELKGEIVRKFDSIGKLAYLGELVNTGEDPACFVKIVVNSESASGGLVDSSFTYVHGSTLSIHSSETDSCLKPGEIGGFKINTPLDSIPPFASVVIGWEADDVTDPRVLPSRVMLAGSIDESTDFFGDRTLAGLIKNDSPLPLLSVKISFVAIKDGQAADTYIAFVKGSPCDPANTCLLPGGSGLFEVDLHRPPSAVDSYYYKINYHVAE